MPYLFQLRIAGRVVAEACEASGLDTPTPASITLKRVLLHGLEPMKLMPAASGLARTDMLLQLQGHEGQALAAFAITGARIMKVESPAFHREVTAEALTLEHQGCVRIR